MTVAGADPRAAGGAASRRMRRLHRHARKQAETLLALAAGEEGALLRAISRVSRWSVAEHLAHLVLVDRTVLERLDRALAPAEPGHHAKPGGLTVAGRVVLGLGYIPRGAGRTPDPFHPEIASLAVLRGDLAEVRERIDRYAGRLGELEASRARFRHFLFGELTAVQWLRFLGVHHHHHLKIIRDIQRAQRAGPAGPAGRGQAAKGS